MNNEPVAIVELGGEITWLTDVLPYKAKLYTHPVKEKDTDCQYCKQGCIRCDARKQLTDEEIRILINEVPDYNIDIYDLMEFARAILRKAQEK